MDKKRRNYKLIVDPFLHRGQHQKVYRFDGINPVDNQLVEVKDPRPRIQRSWFRRQPADLPIPRFKYDCYYVGTPPAKEVTFSNLNDNVNKDFLENMCKSFGKVEECKIYYNPKTKKHMGVGKVVFTSSKAAKSCAEKLNQTSKMGNIMTVVIDTMGKERAKMIEDMLNERRVHHLQKSSSQDSGVHVVKNSLRRETFDSGENEFDFARRTTSFDFTPRSESGYSGSLSESGYSGPTPSSIHSEHSHSVGKSSGHYPDSFKHTPYSDYSTHHSVSQDYNFGVNNFGNHHNAVGPTYDDSGFTQMNPPKFDPTRPPPNHPDFLRREHEPPDRILKDGDIKPETSRSYGSSDCKDRAWHNDDKHHWISNKLRDKGKDRVWDRSWDRGHDKDRGRDRYNNRDSSREATNHGRNYDRSSDYVRDNNMRDREYSRDWEKEKPKVRNKVVKPKIAVEEPDDEPRSLSLESRIQSLLTGNDPDAELDSQTPKPSEEPSLPPPSSHTWDRSPQVPSKQISQTPTSYDHEKNSPSWRASSGHLVHQTPIESPWPQTPQVPESPWPSQTPSVQTPSQAPSDQWNNVDKQSFSYDSNFKPAPTAYNPQQDLKTNTNVQPETNSAPPAADDDDDDDKMSISSISSGEEKLEVNSQIPTTSSQPTSLPNSFPQSVPMFNQGPVPSPWQQGGFVNQDMYPPTYNSFNGMNPFNQTFCNQYQNNIVNAQMVNAYGNQMGYEEEEKVPEIDEKLFNSSLNSFVKDLKEILQKDLCKKMVENSAFKSFEKWWDREEEKRKPPKLIGPQEKSEKPAPSKTAPPSAPQSAMSSTIASLFENRHPWSREGGLESGLGFGQGFGVGGLLGLRGGMPKMPSFKKKMRAPTPPQEEEGEIQDNKSKVMDEEAESEHEGDAVSRPRKPVVSESEEESEEEEGKAQSDDDEENEEESSEEEEESEDESEESSSDEEEEEDEEVDDNELQALQKDIDEEVEGDESKPKVKVEEEESTADDAKIKDDAKPLSPITEEAMEDEDEEVDVETDDTQDTSVTEVKSDAETASQDKDTEAEVKQESEAANSSEMSDSVSPTKDKKKKILPSSMAPELVNLIRKTIKDKKIFREVKTSESEMSADNIPPPVGNEEELSLQKDDESKKPYVNPAIAEHDYFAAPPVQDKSAGDSDATASADEESGGMPHEIWMDHNYCMPRAKFELSESELQDSAKKSVARTSKTKPLESTESDSTASLKDKLKEKPKRKYTKRKNKEEKLTDITHTLNRSIERGSRELANLLPPPKPKVKFSPRSFQEERQTFFAMYQNGIDNEDVGYLKRTYDELMQSDDPMFYWLNDILWVDHPVTNIPDPTPSRKRRKVDDMQYKTHKTGCSRTEGYYKLTMQEKAAYLLHARNVTLQQKVIESINKTIAEQAKKNVVSSRDARNENRRLQTALSDLPELGELLKFNQLKFRKKQLRFAKSSIHDWGLFALEPIAADEMVIEYCGQMVRQSVADLREKKYENTGIGSSYLFRVDGETIIDATKTGNLARFINHSCNPNCYAKIISVEGLKKIVIYSKRDIDVNEEITYDYKFPIEDEKIPCLCMAHGCRGTLN